MTRQLIGLLLAVLSIGLALASAAAHIVAVPLPRWAAIVSRDGAFMLSMLGAYGLILVLSGEAAKGNEK